MSKGKPKRKKTSRHPVTAPRRSSGGKSVNLYCSKADLTNEASVERLFLDRLLADLGYLDGDIKPKTSLRTLVVARGSSRLKYKPDYALSVGGAIRWIADAKGPDQTLDDHLEQCAGYCLGLNRASKEGNPTDHFLISNGLETRFYRWDDNTPVLSLLFTDFAKGNAKYKKMRELFRKSSIQKKSIAPKPAQPFELEPGSISSVNAAFAWCHQFIHRKDSLSQGSAFIEFIKLIFLKLLSDKKYHALKAERGGGAVVAAEVDFSIDWIMAREDDFPNPMSAVQFKRLVERLDEEIHKKKRKRIFDANESIKLSADTVKGVVGRLQHLDLISIDADLNGRLFETFLNATMRGKDLGQYFTPRSVVKLATALADLQVTKSTQDIVMDACCGSGGFLIEALAQMWKKVDDNASLSANERKELRLRIANTKIFGVDISRDPPLARIARMNMYLHGDGGSRVFDADVLDKEMLPLDVDTQDTRDAKEELRDLLSDPDEGFANVILTNPPFAKEYHRKDQRERVILDEYTLATEDAGARKPKQSVRSSVLFLERYHDILVKGGRLIAVIDESILGSAKYRDVRDWIREHFIIRAVVSLPGDAFQRSLARVKTSLIYLVRKTSVSDSQGSVFMSYATAVGVDDAARLRILPGDEALRKQAVVEIDRISRDFKRFLNGELKRSSGHARIVPPEALTDRLDVKSCAIPTGRQERKWKALGVPVLRLEDFVDVLFPLTGEDDCEEQEDNAEED